MSLPENRDYQYNRTMMTFYAFMSVINIGLGLSGALMIGGTGVACGCLAFLQSRHVVLSFREDHLALKPAALAGEIARQASMIAYINSFSLITVAALFIIPLGYLLANPRWRTNRAG